MVTTSQICSTEREIEEYYKTIKLIEAQKGELSLLYKQKETVENDIKNSNIILKTDIQGISYDSPNIQKSKKIVSVQEKALENAFSMLEDQLESIKANIICIEVSIRDLERKNYKIDRTIKGLSEEAKEIIRLIYKDKRTYTQISNQLNMDEATVNRKKDKILTDISKWIYWTEKK